ncbi:bifunctional oligoribonuclease/PAP phosphatase NrnA [Corynebacterium pilosum]|uniref:DHH family phosphoesterase n=1 Tax=Corynebacterium pilosum TaxID=35756 RepID=UPI000A64368D
MQIGQPHPFPENLHCIPGADEVQLGDELHDDALVVTVDCASLDRTGMLADAIAAAPQVLVIDHHVTNPGFGHHNFVADAESTTTLLRDVLTHLGVPLDYELAYCLYAGLVTDTGSFKWGTPRMHTLAAELMEFGLDPRQISMDLMDRISATDLHHLGKIMSGVQIREAHGHHVAVLVVDAAANDHMSQPAIETAIDYVRVLEGTDIGVVLKEMHPGFWSVSLRSSSTDVSKVAARSVGAVMSQPLAIRQQGVQRRSSISLSMPSANRDAQGERDFSTHDLLACFPRARRVGSNPAVLAA